MTLMRTIMGPWWQWCAWQRPRVASSVRRALSLRVRTALSLRELVGTTPFQWLIMAAAKALVLGRQWGHQATSKWIYWQAIRHKTTFRRQYMRPLHMLYSVPLNHDHCNGRTNPQSPFGHPNLTPSRQRQRKPANTLLVSQKITLRVTPNLSICAGPKLKELLARHPNSLTAATRTQWKHRARLGSAESAGTAAVVRSSKWWDTEWPGRALLPPLSFPMR